MVSEQCLQKQDSRDAMRVIMQATIIITQVTTGESTDNLYVVCGGVEKHPS